MQLHTSNSLRANEHSRWGLKSPAERALGVKAHSTSHVRPPQKRGLGQLRRGVYVNQVDVVLLTHVFEKFLA
jgi:hypothetical protein